MTGGGAASPWDPRRLEAARSLQERDDIDGLVLTPGSDLVYLAGYQARAFERLTCLVVPRSADPVIVVPQLELAEADRSAAAQAGVEIHAWRETEDPAAVVGRILGSPNRVGIAARAWFQHAAQLQQAMPDTTLVTATGVMSQLRRVKSAAEIDELRAAARFVDAAHQAIADGAIPVLGRAEHEILADIRALLIECGHREAGAGVVALGPNSGSPHHVAGSRRAQPGDVLLVDIGGTTEQGYRSDCSRTYCVGHPPDLEFGRYADVVEQAHRAAFAVAAPGVTAHAVDAAARTVIEDAGYGPAFTHRTGHGIGLDLHEDPYIMAGNDLVLQPGMCFSIEPGVYLEKRHGARIEDIVAVTTDGVERLNRARHDVAVLAA